MESETTDINDANGTQCTKQNSVPGAVSVAAAAAADGSATQSLNCICAY